MVFGSFVVAFCLIVLGWTAEIVAMFVKEPEKVGHEACNSRYKSMNLMADTNRQKMSLSRWLCLVSMQLTFLSTLVSETTDSNGVKANIIQVQACCRSLIVDTLPIPLQQAGSAWGM